MTKKDVKSPNPELDNQIKKLLRAIDTDLPISEKTKALAVAIQWEKVKYQIAEAGDGSLDSSVFGDD
jgi:hypothetical protein